MTSKLLWTVALFGGTDSLPLNLGNHDLTAALLADLVSPINLVGPGTGFLLGCGIIGLVAMRRLAR